MATKKIRRTNYSWKTSLPAYFDNKKGKSMQASVVLYVLRRLKGKKGSIKEVQDHLRQQFKVYLPQSTISGRINDLRDEGKVAFYGEIKEYRDYRRKIFEIVVKGSGKRAKRGRKIVYKDVWPKHVRMHWGDYVVTLSDGVTWRSKDGKTWTRKRVKKTARKKFGRSVSKG